VKKDTCQPSLFSLRASKLCKNANSDFDLKNKELKKQDSSVAESSCSDLYYKTKEQKHIGFIQKYIVLR